MMQNRWKVVLHTVGLLAIPLLGLGQFPSREALLRPVVPLSIHIAAFPSGNPDSMDVILWTRYHRLALQRDRDDDRFPVALILEWRDTNRFVVRTHLVHDTISLQRDNVLRHYQLRLPVQTYTVAVYFNNRRHQPVFRDTLRIQQRPAIRFFDPLPVANRGGDLVIQTDGGKVLYSPDSGMLILPLWVATDSLTVVFWKMERLGLGDQPAIWKAVSWPSKQGIATIRRGDVSTQLRDSTVQVLLSPVAGAPFHLRGVEQRGWIQIPIAPNQLYPGRYRILLWLETSDSVQQRPVSFSIDVQWVDHPFSLQQLSIAQRFVRLILTSEQYQWLSGGSKSVRHQRFHTFWQYLDPTPQTAYNEALATFYRRIDYAVLNLGGSNLRQTLDDRQKVYVYYGQPDTIYRHLTPGKSPREVWRYDHLPKRTFVFERYQNQRYRLVGVYRSVLEHWPPEPE